MRLRARAFSRFCIVDSNIHISCEEKDEPAFEPLQSNLAFFRVSTSPCPFPIRKHTLGPTHLRITERILLLRYLWKVGIPLELKARNQLPYRVNLWYTEIFLDAVTSWSLYTCECVLVDTLEFHEGSQDSIPVRVGTWNCSVCIARGSGLILRLGGSLMFSRELQWERRL